jgi:hypothetical protein
VGEDLTRTLVEQNSRILDKMSKMEVNIAVLAAKAEERDKLNHEKRISEIEKTINQWLGGKALFLWLFAWIVTTGISVYAAVRR